MLSLAYAAAVLHSLAKGSPRNVGRIVAGLGLAASCWLAVRSAAQTSQIEPTRQTPRVWLCLDVSRSMLAEDVDPNRLEAGKRQLLEAVDTLDNERAVIAVAGRPRLISPFTLDSDFLRRQIAELTVDSAPHGGSDLASLLAYIEQRPPAAHAAEIVVLVSDGGHEPLPQTLPELTRPIIAIGIGDPDSESPIPLPPAGRPLVRRGTPVTTRLDDANLRRLADLSGGEYRPDPGEPIDWPALVESLSQPQLDEPLPAPVGLQAYLLLAFLFALWRFFPTGIRKASVVAYARRVNVAANLD